MKKVETQTYIAEHDHLFKSLIIGDDGTGKSNFLSRYFDDCFSQEYIPTVNLKKFKKKKFIY